MDARIPAQLIIVVVISIGLVVVLFLGARG
jgi:hypothetical protein